jgi:lipopolysaccharide export system permease protein
MTLLRARSLSPPVLLEYIAKTFLMRFAILLAGLAIIMQALDLLAESADLLAADGASTASLWRYTSLRLPMMIAQVVSFAALLASLLTFASLAQHSEIVVMQSTGLSAFRIIFPMMGTCALIALFHFIFHEAIVVESNEEFQRWKVADFSMNESLLPPAPSSAWAVEDNKRIHVEAVRRDGTLLDRVTIYSIGEDMTVTNTTVAVFVFWDDGKWKMYDVTHFETGNNADTAVEREIWNTNIPPERFRALSIDPETVSYGVLSDNVDQLRSEGLTTTRLVAWLHQKIVGPLGTILMPLLASLAGFGVMRSGALFLRVALGLAFGFSYFVVDNLLLAVGQFGTLPPVLAAWAPFVLYLCLGTSVLFHTEE